MRVNFPQLFQFQHIRCTGAEQRTFCFYFSFHTYRRQLRCYRVRLFDSGLCSAHLSAAPSLDRVKPPSAPLSANPDGKHTDRANFTSTTQFARPASSRIRVQVNKNSRFPGNRLTRQEPPRRHRAVVANLMPAHVDRRCQLENISVSHRRFSQ